MNSDIKNKMCVDIEYLEKEILSIYPRRLKLLYEFIEFLVNLKVPSSNQYFITVKDKK